MCKPDCNAIRSPLPGPTPRLRLRLWTPADQAWFRQLNADPRVMRYFPHVLNPAASDAFLDRIKAHHQTHGFSLWAVELRASARLIGFTGLLIPQCPLPFSPCVEIAWRLAHEYWGQGYASEAARAVLRLGFEPLQLAEIVSCTALGNQRSQALMQRLGLQRSASEDFDHPALPSGHPLSRHVLYRLSRVAWQGRDQK